MKESAIPRTIRFLVTALALLAFAVAAPAEQPPELVTFLPVQPTLSRAATAGKRVSVDTSLVARGAASFRIALPDGLSVVALRVGFETRGEGNAVWRGRVGSEESSRVVLTAKNGYVVGRIVSQAALYELRTLPSGGQVIERLDPARFAECAGNIPAPGGPSADQSVAPTVAADTPDQIKVMSLYTPQAKIGAGGQPQIEATIQAA
ncbi:MAG: hypothetical protein R3231_11030, partial [bacterium]|nr:hypothetical protein [bacterium]